MATEPSSQRAYRAACPNCGAPVEFRSPASAFAVCSFCHSTIVRDGDALQKIGESAELFDDHSPLQLGASGKYLGQSFTLVGRLQYRYAEGTWNEWHALFDAGDGGGRSGWLSEDNGHYVIAFDAPLTGAVPAAAELKVGSQVLVEGRAWSVASVSVAKLLAVQGELPQPPNLARGFVVSDLRNTGGEVGTLDYSDGAQPRWSVGRPIAISELAMSGLADAAEKTLKGRAIECPNCGASVPVTLATTQSVVCPQCRSVIDLVGKTGDGVGAQLQHYAQQNGIEPQLPLGSIGTFSFGKAQPLPWQIVGYVERCEVDTGGDEAQSFWREYLLYNRIEGLAFIVDAQDGWSWSTPITGVPEVAGNGVRYRGADFRKLYDYIGMVTYVLGEFYWQVARNQRTWNSDYQGTGSAASRRLNREATAAGQGGAEATQEIVWSAGETMSVEQVMSGFKLAPAQHAALARDALPTSLGGSLLGKIMLWVVIAIVVLMVVRCSTGGGRRNCGDTLATYGAASQEYQSCLNSNRSGGWFWPWFTGYGGGSRSSGGSFGGFSSGGGHK